MLFASKYSLDKSDVESVTIKLFCHGRFPPYFYELNVERYVELYFSLFSLPSTEVGNFPVFKCIRWKERITTEFTFNRIYMSSTLSIISSNNV